MPLRLGTKSRSYPHNSDRPYAGSEKSSAAVDRGTGRHLGLDVLRLVQGFRLEAGL